MHLLKNDSANERLLRVAKGIVTHREGLAFMDVARAMVLLAHTQGEEESRALARTLAISRQTRHNWLTRDLDRWLDAWERRIAVTGKAPLGTTKPKEHRISNDDWRWIAERLMHCIASASWGAKAEYVRDAARYSATRVHLMTISRVTLWRARYRISELMADLQNEPDVEERAPGTDICSEVVE